MAVAASRRQGISAGGGPVGGLAGELRRRRAHRPRQLREGRRRPAFRRRAWWRRPYRPCAILSGRRRSALWRRRSTRGRWRRPWRPPLARPRRDLVLVISECDGVLIEAGC